MNYEMGGTILSKTVKEKDLAVTMNASMKVSEQDKKKYILQLKSGKAVGADDISSEHYKYVLDTSLPAPPN